jgi:hypothetical protein
MLKWSWSFLALKGDPLWLLQWRRVIVQQCNVFLVTRCKLLLNFGALWRDLKDVEHRKEICLNIICSSLQKGNNIVTIWTMFVYVFGADKCMWELTEKARSDLNDGIINEGWGAPWLRVSRLMVLDPIVPILARNLTRLLPICWQFRVLCSYFKNSLVLWPWIPDTGVLCTNIRRMLEVEMTILSKCGKDFWYNCHFKHELHYTW